MKLNYREFKNQIMEIFENNNETITYTTGIISAILILYYNPLLYLTIIGVGTSYGLVKHFDYDLNIDFKMKQIKNYKYDEYENICQKNINIENIIQNELDKKIENSSEENSDILEKLNNSENDCKSDSDSDDSISELKKSIFSKTNDNQNICVGEYFTSSYKN